LLLGDNSIIAKQKLFFFLLPVILALTAIGYFFVRLLPSARTRDFIDTWMRDYQPGLEPRADAAGSRATGNTANTAAAGGSAQTATVVGGVTEPISSTNPASTTPASSSDASATSGSTSGDTIANPAQPAATSATSAQSKSAPVKIVESAFGQAKIGAKYTPGYFELKYPGGDLPADRGVCTDVLIRAFRNAGFDLQQLVNEDMTKNFDKYPNIWGLRRPDPNIDHRRNPNLMCFFKRFGMPLVCEVDEKSLSEWLPGDVVFWRLDSRRLHCGIVIDRKNKKGIPLVVHNLSVCTIEDCLTKWKIIGHFRYPQKSE
jgi:hypothetical protein